LFGRTKGDELMLGVAMYNTIESLWKRGFNKSEIVRMTGHDWKTISKIINHLKKGQGFPTKKPHPRYLDSYQEQIIQWLEEDLSGVRIHEKLISLGLAISYSTVKNFIQDIKKNQAICIRFHTAPGEEAQVDFGYIGTTLDSSLKLRKTWIFNMRLSYSRLDYYEKVYDQRVETFIQCHINAFQYFGGVPRFVKIDNLKAAILQAHFYEPIYQSLYKQFAIYYGFHILPCRVRQPQEKGKVEAGIKYFKINFMAGRTFSSSDDFNQQLNNWLERICHQRIHGTTREKPHQLFEEKEKSFLLALPQNKYRLPQVGQRLVYHDCHIYIDYNYYSVPYEFVGKTVDVEIEDHLVKIFYENLQIALHTQIKEKGKFSTKKEHYPKYKLIYSSENQKTYEIKMNELGNDAKKLFNILIEKQPYHWLRTVQGILSLKKQFDSSIINLSCRRALMYGVLEYRKIRNICENGSYHLPIDQQEEVLH
jgi:transposase